MSKPSSLMRQFLYSRQNSSIGQHARPNMLAMDGARKLDRNVFQGAFASLIAAKSTSAVAAQEVRMDEVRVVRSKIRKHFFARRERSDHLRLLGTVPLLRNQRSRREKIEEEIDSCMGLHFNLQFKSTSTSPSCRD